MARRDADLASEAKKNGGVVAKVSTSKSGNTLFGAKAATLTKWEGIPSGD